MARNLLGAAYLEKGMLEPAEREIRLSLEKRPRMPDAHYNLGLIAEERGDPGRRPWRNTGRRSRSTRRLSRLFQPGPCLHEDRRPAGEIENLKKAIEVKPGFAKAYLFLAKAYLDGGEDFDEAIGLARKGLELEPEADSAPLGHYVLADIYDRMGRVREYREELEKGRLLEQKLRERRDR